MATSDGRSSSACAEHRRRSHRVVLELSELQLPTLSRGTDVAVYTHVTSDHLDRHGDVEAYRAVKRRLAELLPPAVSSSATTTTPWRRGTCRPGRLTVPYTREAPPMGGLGVRDGWRGPGPAGGARAGRRRAAASPAA